jgi:hypothetical protein
MVFSLFGWHRRRRNKPKAQPTPQELLRSAVAELGIRERDPKRIRSHPQHGNSFRALVVDGAEKTQLSDALMAVAQDSQANPHLRSDEQNRMVLRGRPESDEQSKREAERAAREVEEQMGEEWVRSQRHYYAPNERSQTGEVDRTYVIEEGKTRGKAPDRTKRR